MKTIFLASGKSSRCAPLGDKNLLEFCGEPLLLKLLKNAHQGGLENFIIVSNGENDDSIAQLLTQEKFLKNTLITPQKNLDEGMAGGIQAGLAHCQDDEDIIILGGNDFVEPEIYKTIIETGQKGDGAILAQKVDQYFPGGYLALETPSTLSPKRGDASLPIKSIVEKPGEGQEPSDLVNIIGHYFHKSYDLKKALSEAQSSRDDVYEVALDHLFKTKNFQAVPYTGTWQAIKFPWHVLEMKNVFLARQIADLKNSGKISEYQEIKEKVWVHQEADIQPTAIFAGENILVEKNAKIFHNAVINSDVYLGENSVVGNNALVRDAIIGKNSCVGYNTEVARSILMSNVTSHIAYIGDSIVESGVNFGAYSCTANLRLDKKTIQVPIKNHKIDSGFAKLGAIIGQNAQIGIHACLMPGVKIPAEDFVKPGEVR
jgi:NDP-sugar pyrophosphorylase family protein